MRYFTIQILLIINVIVLILLSACDQQKIELIKLAQIKTIKIQDNSPAAILWSPKQLNITKIKVISLLQNATKTTITIPEQPKVTFYGYIGTVKLLIEETDGSQIRIKPASYLAKWKKDENGNQMYHTVYINDSISFEQNGKVTYYNDPKLYDWLKSNNWKIAFSWK